MEPHFILERDGIVFFDGSTWLTWQVGCYVFVREETGDKKTAFWEWSNNCTFISKQDNARSGRSVLFLMLNERTRAWRAACLTEHRWHDTCILSAQCSFYSFIQTFIEDKIPPFLRNGHQVSLCYYPALPPFDLLNLRVSHQVRMFPVATDTTCSGRSGGVGERRSVWLEAGGL